MYPKLSSEGHRARARVRVELPEHMDTAGKAHGAAWAPAAAVPYGQAPHALPTGKRVGMEDRDGERGRGEEEKKRKEREGKE